MQWLRGKVAPCLSALSRKTLCNFSFSITDFLHLFLNNAKKKHVTFLAQQIEIDKIHH